MGLSPQDLQIGRRKISQVFRYLEALNQLRNPVKRLIEDQPWVLWCRELPEHSAVTLERFEDIEQEEEPRGQESSSSLEDGDGLVLRVARPRITIPPSPPEEIVSWLRAGWGDLDGSIEVHPSRNEPDESGETQVVRFEDDAARVDALEAWRVRREQWMVGERPARLAAKLFERLYELHGQIEREAERVELVVGDGILSWRLPDGGIHHPVLLQRVQLEFRPEIPEFIIRETEHGPEIYSALFRALPDVDGRQIGRCREELDKGGYHPLGQEATAGFLRRLVTVLGPQGEFLEGGAPRTMTDQPRIGRDPVIFVRARIQGFATAIEAILEDIQIREDLPASLVNIVGIDTALGRSSAEDSSETAGQEPPDADILLSKPANQEQVEIAQRLEKYGCVLVQGPPGTGKTHTIANLVGHLLAHRKSVLITSHTTKALRVLRDHVVRELQPLCVSVLESDLDSRRQLESSVDGIVERLSSANPERLEKEAIQFRQTRTGLLDQLRELENRILDARPDEYRPVLVGGEEFSPTECARRVGAKGKDDNWIPGPVTLGSAVALSDAQLLELYRTNFSVSSEDERELGAPLPKPDELLAPSDFHELVSTVDDLQAEDVRQREDLWESPPEGQDEDVLERLHGVLRDAALSLGNDDLWKLAATIAGRDGGIHVEPWQNLIDLVKGVSEEAAKSHEVILTHGPVLARDMPLDEQLKCLDEITKHLERGGKLNGLTLLAHRRWKRLVAGVRVGAKQARTHQQFRALLVLARLREFREQLLGRWERQMVPLGGPTRERLGADPEKQCLQFVPALETSLGWHAKVWSHLEEDMRRCGFRWATCFGECPPDLRPFGELRRLQIAVLQSLPPVFGARLKRIRLAKAHAKLAGAQRQLDLFVTGDVSADVVRVLKESLARGDTAGYRIAFERLVELQQRRTDVVLRQDLLRRLEPVAPAWAAAVRERKNPHDRRDPPGDAKAAWLWRQWNDELERRAKTSLEGLQREAELLRDDLQRTTASLIDRLAWAAQARRTRLPQRQALMGWLQTIRRIGKGTGKRAPRLQAEARKLMAECRASVPVWIMPLARAVENFDPRKTRVDVVIIDEASQSDVMALVALYMGAQVVVVGDHEQVSPDAVGQKLDEVQHLIDEHLGGIPNANLYDGQMSVYDLAMQAFGGTICLREHFRCVPEIIQFSNYLSYDGRIRPLRDGSLVQERPPVISYRVPGVADDNGVNEEEALTVVALIEAAIEQPEYEEKTFGIISMVGDEQARFIERLLRQRISPVEYESRRIVCGNAAQFQGDERDVMVLSVVDSPRIGGPLRLREEPRFKKRFNVAASRARDQMWVVHSLDPRLDLQARDLRRLLIEHAENPAALMRRIDEGEGRVESELERQVVQRLVSAGYRVTSQWKAGAYRIDLVVQGGQRRLAVECDGDRYHTLENLADDMARQAVLERLGWRFVRVRGTEFFRDGERAMRPVWAKLEQFGISPEGHFDASNDSRPPASELHERLIRRVQELRLGREKRDDEAAGSANRHRVVLEEVARVQEASAASQVSKTREFRESPSITKVDGVEVLAEKPVLDRAKGSVEGTDRRLGGMDRDRVLSTLRSHLGSQGVECKKCNGPMTPMVGRYGPFAKCNRDSCANTMTMSPKVLAGALADLDARCKVCSAPLLARTSKYGGFIGCSKYPECNERMSWQDLRKSLMQP